MRAVDPSRSRIVIVGAWKYEHADLRDVPAVANNIADLESVFKDPYIGGFDDSNCIVLPADASKQQVGAALNRAADEAEDLLLFYFAGHGVVSSRPQELHLCLADSGPGSNLPYSAVSFSAIRRTYLNAQAANRVVILDCCYAGRAIHETLAAEGDDLINQVEVAGTYTLAAAAGFADVDEDAHHTAFTGHLLALLTEGIEDAGPTLTLGDIYLRLRGRLRAEGHPLPQHCGTDTADRLGLVRNRKDPSTPQPPPDPVTPAPDAVATAARAIGTSFLSELKRGWAMARAAHEAGYLGPTHIAPPSGDDQLASFAEDAEGLVPQSTEVPAAAGGTVEITLEQLDFRAAASRIAAASSYLLALNFAAITAWVWLATSVTLNWLILLVPAILCALVTGGYCVTSDKLSVPGSYYVLVAAGNVGSAVLAIIITATESSTLVAVLIVYTCFIVTRARHVGQVFDGSVLLPELEAEVE